MQVCNYADLSKRFVLGRDYRIQVCRRESQLAVIAPHGGAIEPGTSELASRIAADDMNLYLFEGLRPANNYKQLHLTSTQFDEPQCLELLRSCDQVVAIHGCEGSEERIYVGGLDANLSHRIVQAFQGHGIDVRPEDHKFPAINRNNICNRGRTGQGVQLEFTRRSRRRATIERMAQIVRLALLDSLK